MQANLLKNPEKVLSEQARFVQHFESFTISVDDFTAKREEYIDSFSLLLCTSIFFFFSFLHLFVYLFVYLFIFSIFPLLRALEDASLKGLHRLVSRSVHALALIDLLRSAQEDKKLPVPWVTLNKMSFRSLVVSHASHDIVKKMLVGLVGGASKVGEVTLADQITTRLTSECFQVRALSLSYLIYVFIFLFLRLLYYFILSCTVLPPCHPYQYSSEVIYFLSFVQPSFLSIP
jgi:hypothetical protein